MASTSATAALPDDLGAARDAWLVNWGIIARHCVRMVRFFICTACWRPSSVPNSSPAVNDTTGFHFRLGGPSPPASRCGRSARWSSDGWAIWWGRKYTFLITMSIMGGATFFGRSAAELRDRRPLRRRSCWWYCALLQGLALGGEYGGAATYVCGGMRRRVKRGLFTSWIQTTATLGLFCRVVGGHRYPHAGRRGRVQSMGLARTLPAIRGAARRFPVDSHAAVREPGVFSR